MGMEGPQTGQQEHRAEQRRRIIAAAAVCFSRDGFHGTSMQQICAEAGMSPGALYRYFPSKESLIGAIVEGERADRARILDALDGAPSLVDGLRDCLDIMLAPEPLLPCKALGPEVMAEAIRNEKLRDALEPVEEETRGRLAASLEAARARGEIDPEIDLETLTMLFSMIGDGLILHNLLHPEWHLAGRADALSDLIRRMIAPPAGEVQT
ncbi:MAG: TetR/AcrR family transcriptional regulator [Pseudomonadota bacterium]